MIDEEREKCRAKNGSLQNTLADSKGTAFVILKKTCKRTYQKGKIESSEQSKEGGQPK